MSEKERDDFLANTLSQFMLRLSSLENVLLSKGVVSEAELAGELRKSAEKVVKVIKEQNM